MKKLVFLIFTVTATVTAVTAQGFPFPSDAYPSNVYTPESSIVNDTWVFPELLTNYEIITARNLANNTNIILVADATTTYNCHGYAWYMSEGGSQPVWMGWSTKTIKTYWEDGSYIVTNSTDTAATKIAYLTANGDEIHSAVIIKNDIGKNENSIKMKT